VQCGQCFDLPQPVAGRDCELMVYLYCDESGKAHNSPIVSLCGYILDMADIYRLNVAWHGRRERAGVPPIHMREIYRPDEHPKWLQVKREWGSKWSVKRDELLVDLAQLICDFTPHFTQATGVMVDADYFLSGACPKLNKKVGGDPIYLAFRKTVLPCIERAERATKDVGLGVVVDDDYDTAPVFHAWVNTLKHDNREPLGRSIKSLCFVDDERFPLIQAADMLAYAARQQLIPPKPGDPILPPEIYEKLTRDRVYAPKFLDAAELDKLELEA
jgi:hypothetical protein